MTVTQNCTPHWWSNWGFKPDAIPVAMDECAVQFLFSPLKRKLLVLNLVPCVHKADSITKGPYSPLGQ